MDTIVKDIKVCIWYLDYIFIYGGNTKAKHQAVVEKVLQQCVKHGLAVNLLKSEFYIHRPILLRKVIYRQEVTMDPAKLKTIPKWPIIVKK